MTTCPACDRPMTGPSYNARPWQLDGLPVEAIRYGSESGLPPRIQPECHDCGTPIGGHHHNGCCVEQCPHDAQAISAWTVRNPGRTPHERLQGLRRLYASDSTRHALPSLHDPARAAEAQPLV